MPESTTVGSGWFQSQLKPQRAGDQSGRAACCSARASRARISTGSYTALIF